MAAGAALPAGGGEGFAQQEGSVDGVAMILCLFHEQLRRRVEGGRGRCYENILTSLPRHDPATLGAGTYHPGRTHSSLPQSATHVHGNETKE